MNIAKARQQLNVLKAAILADGKVDWTETEVLLDFIAPYVDAQNQKFVKLAQLLHKCRADGKITDSESKEIIAAIESASKFLKVERDVEWFLAGALAAIAAGAIIFHIITKVFT